jgi:hypothetical protein
MATYPILTLESQQKKRSPFVALEGYITFYAMSDWTPGKLRSAMTPLGTYLFWQGFSIDDARNYLPPLQAFGSKSKNLTACESQESKVSINGMMVQVGDDCSWFAAGHAPLLAFVDFVADPGILPSNQKDDIKNANNLVNQTIVVKDLNCATSQIAGSDSNLVTWNLTFFGGEVVYLDPTTMDLP